jgi:LysM repeat protein
MVALAYLPMSKWPASWRISLIFVFCCLFSGCLPISDTPVDDEKDPNFIEGRNHYNMMDWKGATEAYERAVRANPRNAQAHFELGVLYQDKLNDPISAAFHYKKHLELRPKSSYTETVNAGLVRCRMDIAKTVNYQVIGQEVHKDLQRLTNELIYAKREAETLRGQMAAKPMVVTQWMKFTITNYFTNYIQVPVAQLGSTSTQAPRSTLTNTLARTNTQSQSPRATQLPPTRASSVAQQPTTRAEIRTAPPTATRNRTYTVRAGETMAEVARRFGVSLPKLQAANPTIQPRSMKAGQTLNIPSQ